MAPNTRARQNHEALFPQHVSTLATTDPELIEIFDNFAFDEVLQGSTLDVRTRLMVQLAAIIASPAVREYRVMLGAALNAGVTPVEAKEIVYQAIPYAGQRTRQREPPCRQRPGALIDVATQLLPFIGYAAHAQRATCHRRGRPSMSPQRSTASNSTTSCLLAFQPGGCSCRRPLRVFCASTTCKERPSFPSIQTLDTESAADFRLSGNSASNALFWRASRCGAEWNGMGNTS